MDSVVSMLKQSLAKRAVKESVLFSLSSVFFQGSKFSTFLLAAKLLGPEIYGLWNGIVLILMYGPNIHLGVLNALNREIPYQEGAGNHEKVVVLRNTGAGVVFVTAVPLSLSVFCISFLPWIDHPLDVGLRYVAVILFFQYFYIFQQMLLRSHGLFSLMSIQQVLYSIATILIILPATYYFKFDGFLGGQIIVLIVTLLFLRGHNAIKVKPRFLWVDIFPLIKIGFPIMMVSLAYSLLQSIDRLFIVKYLGKVELGYYTLSIMATGILTLFPMVVGQVVYPRMARKFGKTRRIEDLKPLIYTPTVHLLWSMAVLLTAVYFFAPFLVETFLPEYARGLDALRITIFGLLFLSLVGGFANFLNTVGLQKTYLATLTIAITIGIALNYASMMYGYGIEGIAAATSITYFLYLLIIMGVSFKAMGSGDFKSRMDG
ncbi:MATE family efflux transporter [Pelobacter seleniigenes]|uniref:MATE family efflux transporter n=1 Tax=Pelobacter seleniigenes TaxID=407188 RepID=UPI0012B70A8C|nr:MATE family efflux transporter [Pelobacter seleniigenes]